MEQTPPKLQRQNAFYILNPRPGMSVQEKGKYVVANQRHLRLDSMKLEHDVHYILCSPFFRAAAAAAEERRKEDDQDNSKSTTAPTAAATSTDAGSKSCNSTETTNQEQDTTQKICNPTTRP